MPDVVQELAASRCQHLEAGVLHKALHVPLRQLELFIDASRVVTARERKLLLVLRALFIYPAEIAAEKLIEKGSYHND